MYVVCTVPSSWVQPVGQHGRHADTGKKNVGGLSVMLYEMAALVSGLEIHAAGGQLDLDGLQLVELGSLPLTLAVRGDKSSADSPFPTVLLPMRSIAAGLHRALQGLNLSLRAAGHSCNSAEQWLQRLNNHGLAIPIYHHPASWAFWCQQLSPLPLFRSIEVGVGLLLPDEVHPAGVLLDKLEASRHRIHSTKA